MAGGSKNKTNEPNERGPGGRETVAREPGRFAYGGLERVIHEKARLSILASLASHADGLLFNDLKALCALTDGNLSRQRVCGRLFLNPFHTSTKPASCSTCSCRLRLPSVRAHSAFKSLKRSPSTWLASDARMLSRAFSWMTRARPS